MFNVKSQKVSVVTVANFYFGQNNGTTVMLHYTDSPLDGLHSAAAII